MDIARALASRLPGSRVRPNAFGGATLVFEVDGVWLDARVVDTATLEIFVRTLDVPGLTLNIDSAGRKLPLPAHRDPSHVLRVVDHDAAIVYGQLDATRSHADLTIEHDDDPLAAIWVDPPAVEALVAALWPIRTVGMLFASAQLESFHYELGGGTVAISRRTQDLDRIHRAFVAAATIAARPHRLGRAWLDVARDLGGTTTVDRWDLADHGGEFAVTIDRGAVEVRVDNVRRHPDDADDHRGLYTRVRARRIAAAASDAAALVERARAHPLFDAAAPSVVGTVDDLIELWWPGLVVDLARLGPAVELVARLAGELDASAGPYR